MKRVILSFLVCTLFAVIGYSQNNVTLKLAGQDNGTVIQTSVLQQNPVFTVDDPNLTITDLKIQFPDPNVSAALVDRDITGNAITPAVLQEIAALPEPVKVYAQVKCSVQGGGTVTHYFSFAKQN